MPILFGNDNIYFDVIENLGGSYSGNYTPPLAGQPLRPMWNVYILQSLKDNKHYIGSTGNLEQRLKHHNLGYSKATKNRRPFMLIYSEIAENKIAAVKREFQIKRYKGGEAFKNLLRKTI